MNKRQNNRSTPGDSKQSTKAARSEIMKRQKEAKNQSLEVRKKNDEEGRYASARTDDEDEAYEEGDDETQSRFFEHANDENSDKDENGSDQNEDGGEYGGLAQKYEKEISPRKESLNVSSFAPASKGRSSTISDSSWILHRADLDPHVLTGDEQDQGLSNAQHLGPSGPAIMPVSSATRY